MENNLSETAFFVGKDGKFDLRWFTPTAEVDLCGHATLAAAYVICNELHETSKNLIFNTKSGELIVNKSAGLFVMDFPSQVAHNC